MPNNGSGNGKGKLTLQPSVLPIPKDGSIYADVKISGVPHTAGTLTYKIEGATESEIWIVPESIVRGQLTPECANDSAFITLSLSSFLTERKNNENPKLIVYDGEKEIECFMLSLAPIDSDLVRDATAAAQDIANHRAIVAAGIKASQTEPGSSAPAADGVNSPESETPIEIDYEKKNDSNPEKGSAPDNAASTTDNASSTTKSPTHIEVDQGNGKDNPRSTPTESAAAAHDDENKPGATAAVTQTETLPATTVPTVKPAEADITTAEVIEVQPVPVPPVAPTPAIPTSNGHGGTTVNVQIATDNASSVHVGEITVNPVGNGATATASPNGTSAGSAIAPDFTSNWRLEPRDIPLDGRGHTLTLDGKGIPGGVSIMFNSEEIQLNGKPRRLGGSYKIPVKTRRCTIAEVTNEIKVDVTLEWDGGTRTLEKAIRLQPMEGWRASKFLNALMVVLATIIAGAIILTFAVGSGRLVMASVGQAVWTLIASTLDLYYVYKLRQGHDVVSPLGLFAAVATIIAVSAALLGGN